MVRGVESLGSGGEPSIPLVAESDFVSSISSDGLLVDTACEATRVSSLDSMASDFFDTMRFAGFFFALPDDFFLFEPDAVVFEADLVVFFFFF